MVCPGAMERYLSWGDTIAAWKSIECIIGAAVRSTPGMVSAVRFVILKRIRSPTRARTVGPGTWPANVHALYLTPGAISMILCTVSRRTSFTGAGSSALNAAVIDRAPPAAKGPPPPLSLLTRAGFGFRSIFAGSYGSNVVGCRPSHATRHHARTNPYHRVDRTPRFTSPASW